jgi:hypothetical protein
MPWYFSMQKENKHIALLKTLKRPNKEEAPFLRQMASHEE